MNVSPDGRTLAFVFFDSSTNFDIWTMHLETGKREALGGDGQELF